MMLGKGLEAFSKAPRKEEREGLGREGDKMKFVDVRFEIRLIVGIGTVNFKVSYCWNNFEAFKSTL